MIFIIGGLWLYVPNLSLFIFLVLSAYHFGQSQFVDYSFPDALSTRFLYLSWGLVLFTLLFFLKSEQLQSDFSNYLPNITSWGFIADNSFVIFCCTLVMWLTLFIYKIIVHNKSVQGIFSEIYLLFLISISFYIFPTLIGFSLYFIILHSFRSLDQEFNHLFSDYTKQNIWNFIKLLLPFSALAIIGSALIIFILYRLGYQTHLPYLLLIILSSITTPHTFVMDYFLEKGRHSSILSDSVQI
jgi:Brp/Blh family beta-carotene 15,15'-monooxygenase